MAQKPNLLSVIFLLLSFCSFAQQPTGNLQGRVLDDTRRSLLGANVVLSSPDLQGVRGASTDENGFFQVLALPVGMYQVKISYVGYGELTIERIQVQLGQTTNLGEVGLPRQSEQIEKVVILGERPLLDPSTATTGANFTLKTIEALPVDRNFRSVMELAPQATKSYYFDGANLSGATGLENLYFIDGMNVTDPIAGNGGTNLPYNFIREVQVKTGGYEAEYQSALGGVVNVVTHSGGNELQGQAFAFYSSDNLQSEPRYNPYQTDVDNYLQTDVGFGFGGPVLRDKLWFYMAYNYLREQKDIELVDFGAETDRLERHSFAGKLTWRVADQTEMAFTAFGDPSTRDIVGTPFFVPEHLLNIDPVLGRRKKGGTNLSLRFRHQFGQRLLLNTTLSRYQAAEKNIGRTEIGNTEPLFFDFTTSTLSGGYGILQNDKSQRLAAKITGTLLLRDHTIKAGFEVEDNSYTQNASYNTPPGGIIYKFSDNYYQTLSYLRKGTVHNQVSSAFLQDAWLIAPNLRVNAGIRWNAEYITGGNEQLAQRITDELQPRLGLIYQPGIPGTQKVFASYGRFYEQLPGLFLSRFIEMTYSQTIFPQDPRESLANADTIASTYTIATEVKDLRGQYYDEFSIGYERRLGNHHKAGIRGTYRAIGEVVEDIFDFENGGESIFGNPGRGKLSDYPEFTRKFLGLEFTFQRLGAPSFNYLVSYLLSRNYGNYPGLYDPYLYLEGFFNTNFTRQLVIKDQIPNSEGLLPNDRTHLLKFNGSYRFDFGLNVGATFTWMSGTPLNELGASFVGPPVYVYLQERGTAGRTPATYDLNFRLTYDLNQVVGWGGEQRLIVDLFHVGNPQRAVWLDEVRYNALDENGNQTSENPQYLQPRAYQPPMTLRVGVELGF